MTQTPLSLSIKPQHTWALLIGMGEFPRGSRLPAIPAVTNNLTKLQALLTNPDILGIPPGQVKVIKNQAQILGQVIDFINKLPDSLETLIVYYVGHGITDAGQLLYLANSDSLLEHPETALPFAHLWEKTTDSAATNLVYLLDCCLSGKAMNTAKKRVGKNISVLTATLPNHNALAPPGETYTTFTKHLVELLEGGVGNEFTLTTTAIRKALAERLSQGQPKPWGEDFLDTVDTLRIAYNRAYLSGGSTMLNIFHLPLPQNRFFTGRNEILEKLHRILTQENSVALYSVALNGIGGVGKTQTALEYAYRYQSEYQAILWVSGDGEDMLRLNFANLTGVLGLPKLDKQEDAIAAVRNWLNTHDQWLLIIDNAETAKELKAASDLIPQTTRGRRLFTTRTQAIGHFAEPLEIDCLEDMSGGVLLVRRARLVDWRLSSEEVSTTLKKRDWQTAQEISRELGGLPLAIDQAGAYIEQNTLGLQDYLSRYHDYAPHMLKFESQGQYPRSVYVAFQMALEKVEKREPLAGEVLRMCAFLHPDGIPIKLFNKLSNNPLLLDVAMAALNDYSLVKRIPERKLLTVHRVVQQVVKEVCPDE